MHEAESGCRPPASASGCRCARAEELEHTAPSTLGGAVDDYMPAYVAYLDVECCRSFNKVGFTTGVAHLLPPCPVT